MRKRGISGLFGKELENKSKNLQRNEKGIHGVARSPLNRARCGQKTQSKTRYTVDEVKADWTAAILKSRFTTTASLQIVSI